MSFIVFALPRSRTRWLSEFLSYGDWHCRHEQAIFMRSMQDVRDLFELPRTGTVETGVMYGWRLLRHMYPDLKMAVIRRPVREAVDAMMRVDISSVGAYDRSAVEKLFLFADRMLQQIAGEPGNLSLPYAALETREGCKTLFEFCLPYKFDAAHWENMRHQKIEMNVPAMLSYFVQHKDEIAAFKRLVRRELRQVVERH